MESMEIESTRASFFFSLRHVKGKRKGKQKEEKKSVSSFVARLHASPPWNAKLWEKGSNFYSVLSRV